ncbi:hypothetical protein VB796_06955 [Arcicella sp. LKC2W]|uniref:hypothetical protein n=1 Tax=Arcicella sp. LKC2W TaxID=2984198 RepID=UPI002B21F998|nr:hypothetical protein [Arcicella sp. LKC2W]MEA5458767.1 hypothetical protein [Arcicella sp. LKC2W]
MTKYLETLNLKKILLLGLFFRLLAIIFSKGYAFTDDHFEVIEITQNLLDGLETPFPNFPKGTIYLFSLVYPGVHYVIFGLCEFVGIYNPEVKMFVGRLVHGLFSLLTIYYGYKITERLTNRANDAKIVGLLLAIFWVLPFLSVRNLRELACVPPLLIGCYYALEKNLTTKHILWSAWWFTIAFVFRYQIVFIPFVVGLNWLLSKQNWQKALIFGVLMGVFFMLTQGLLDYFYWGNPFASIQAYIEYNSDSTNISAYPNGPWHRYIGTVAGLFLAFPFLLLLAGYFKTATQGGYRAVFFWASLFFFAFHSYYANKQERFIMPFLPYFIILGTIGFRDLYEQFSEKKWLQGFTKFAIIWGLVLNTILLCVLSVTYTKRSRVESMNYLREKGDLNNFVLQNYEFSQPEAPFYLQKRYDYYTVDTHEKMADLPNQLKLGKKVKPNYIILVGNSDLEKRLAEMKAVFPTMEHEIDIEPSLGDNIAYLLNPSHNHNETFYIYKIRD